MMLRTVLAAALVLAAVPAFAIEPETGQALTRTAAADAPRPKAELADLDWLIGSWAGEGIEGAEAMEHWSAPVGGAMPGIFVQTNGKGGTMFSEYMQIVPDGESLMVRLKHFNADLTGWEEKDKMVTFPLIGHEKGALYFRGLSYLRRGDNRLIVAVRMREADGSSHELVFRFRRVGR